MIVSVITGDWLLTGIRPRGTMGADIFGGDTTYPKPPPSSALYGDLATQQSYQVLPIATKPAAVGAGAPPPPPPGPKPEPPKDGIDPKLIAAGAIAAVVLVLLVTQAKKKRR